MNIRLLLGACALLLSGCAVYQELEPKVPLSSEEKGFIELNHKKGKKFEIDKDEKYFLAFPAPASDNHYLVLKFGNRKGLETALAGSKDDEGKFGDKIADASERPDSLSVYPIQSGKPGYYLLLEKVPDDMELVLDYRYVPQWRFNYETKYAGYRKTLAENKVDRKTYAEIGKSIPPEKLPAGAAIEDVDKRLAVLEKVYQEILATEKIFPKSILNSADTAYRHYVSLKKDVEDELAFQGKYAGALKYFQKIQEVKGNAPGFLDHVDRFNAFYSRKPPQEEHVLKAARTLLQDRLAEVMLHYRKSLADKQDADPFGTKFRLVAFRKTMALHDTAGIPVPEPTRQLSAFIEEYEKAAGQLVETGKGYRAVQDAVAAGKGLPATGFFQGNAAALGALQIQAPKPLGSAYGDLASLPGTQALNREVSALAQNLEKGKAEYTDAEGMVVTTAPLLEQERYSEALGILKQKRHLGFLMERYRPLDQASVQHQAGQISQALSAFAWGRAESGLSQLHGDENYLFPAEIAPVRKEAVSKLEDSLYMRVDERTRQRVDKFVEERWQELIKVDELYSDSVFLPVHDIRFTTGGKAALIDRKEKLVAHLAKLKVDEFPAKAIKLLYDEFLKRPEDKGVLKARAVVSHGKHYKGNNKEIHRRIHECDPYGPKLITEPTKYRRVFALPITTKKGVNTYLCRLNVKVETDAKFPVYDVNIKLPETVAKNAGSSKWFDKITLDKQPLMSEGRFSITTPTAENGFESQITPVRMNKDADNLLDIYFNHESLTVLPISVMVQKPIIKKN